MSIYLKLDFNTPSRTNSSLKQVLIYIGKYNGKLAFKEGRSNKEYLNSGICFVAKQFGSLKKNAIKKMIYAKKIKKSENKQWCFHKEIYARAYLYIVELLFKAPKEDAEYISDLLHRLYSETLKYDPKAAKMCSNAIIFWQKKILQINSMHVDADIAEHSMRLFNTINKNDRHLPRKKA